MTMVNELGPAEAALQSLLGRLDEPLALFSQRDMYYRAGQPLAYLAPESRVVLGSRLGRLAVNVPRLAVGSLVERLRVLAFYRDGQHDAELWADWTRNDMDEKVALAHREVLTLGACYILVWGDGQGRPTISVESARQVAVQRDPATGRITSAVKRWATEKGTEAVLFEADRVTRWHADQPGATTQGFRLVETIRNPFGRPPIVGLVNSDRLLDHTGASEIDDLIPLVDALNKLVVDMLTGSEYTAKPRRWASGVELEERPLWDAVTGAVLRDPETGEVLTELVNPFPEGTRMMTAEDPQSRFGSLPAADLGGYEAAVRVLLQSIMAVSALPAHYLGVMSSQPRARTGCGRLRRR
jgi:hypothetical protein